MKAKPVRSELHTTEASESRRAAKADQTVPDPPDEEGREILEGEEEETSEET